MSGYTNQAENELVSILNELNAKNNWGIRLIHKKTRFDLNYADHELPAVSVKVVSRTKGEHIGKKLSGNILVMSIGSDWHEIQEVNDDLADAIGDALESWNPKNWNFASFKVIKTSNIGDQANATDFFYMSRIDFVFQYVG